MERTKRVKKPNKRYMAEPFDFLPKKAKKSTKLTTSKEPVKRLLQHEKRYHSSAVNVPELKNPKVAETTETVEESIPKPTSKKTPVEKDSSINQSEAAAQKIKSLIEAAGETQNAKPRSQAEDEKRHIKSDSACKKHKRKKNKKFTVDCTDVEFINVHDLLNYMQRNIKIDGQKNNFGNQLKFDIDGNKMVVSGKTDMTMQYLKGLAKQFLHKNKLYCVRVVNKNPILKYIHKE